MFKNIRIIYINGKPPVALVLKLPEVVEEDIKGWASLHHLQATTLHDVLEQRKNIVT